MEIEPWLPRAAAARPERLAIEAADGSLTYGELLGRARAGASVLTERGVRVGDRVALALGSGAELAVALHATWLLGAIAVPVDLRLPASERALRTVGVAATVDSPLPDAGGEPTAPPASAVARHELACGALLVYTSGTTAAPKPVELTFGNLLWSALGSALALGLDPAERWLCPMPLAHVGGLSILTRSAIYGTTAVLHERFDPGAVLRAVMEGRITLVSLVPTMLARLLDAGLRDPQTLRCALIGGGPMAPELMRRAGGAGIPAAQTYGITEACSQVTTSAAGEPQTAGPALTGTTVRIAPDGEILVCGPTVAPAALGPEGCLHTGDLGVLDERGHLTVTGRKADTIVSGGENVAPVEVEAALLEHPAVADAAVHGRPDSEWGEAVVATVVVRDGQALDPDVLREHCAARLARFKVPKQVRFAERLPRTASGKLLRRELSRE